MPLNPMHLTAGHKVGRLGNMEIYAERPFKSGGKWNTKEQSATGLVEAKFRRKRLRGYPLIALSSDGVSIFYFC